MYNEILVLNTGLNFRCLRKLQSYLQMLGKIFFQFMVIVLNNRLEFEDCLSVILY